MLFLDKTPDLSATDLDIYKYVVANLGQVCFMRVRDLADATYTSTASILRFCRKFECEGYTEFRIKLQMYHKLHPQTALKNDDETAYINFLHRSTESYYQDKINEAAKLLLDKELILFLGLGSSNIMAEYGALYFSSIFNMALRVEDPNNYPINYLSENLASKMCVITLSVSGEAKEIIEYLNHLNLSHSSTISITNSSNCTVAKLSDVNIPYYIARESFEGADITSQLPALYTIEHLAKRVRELLIEGELQGELQG